MFLFLALGSFVLYFSIAGASYSMLLMQKKEKSFPRETFDRTKNRKAIVWSLINIIGNALLTSPIQVLVIQGYSRVYFTVDEYGWEYLLLTPVAYLAFTETGAYWMHRAQHLPWLQRSIHQYHHQFRVPTPWVSMAFHPVDSLLQGIPYYLYIFLLPTHIGVYLGFMIFIMIWAFLIHDGITFFASSTMNHSSHHVMHHLNNKYNYGQFFTFWDRIGKTYRPPNPDSPWAVAVTQSWRRASSPRRS
jgi:lathosterol oxidase